MFPLIGILSIVQNWNTLLNYSKPVRLNRLHESSYSAWVSTAFLWTEHADFTDIRLHKITYFGNEMQREFLKRMQAFHTIKCL